MFRHLVVTGRSRLALYLARIPAGLAIIVPLVAVGFTIVCAVCVFAAPTRLKFNGVTVPVNLSQAGLETLGGRPCGRGHLQLRLQDRAVLPDGSAIAAAVNTVPCGNGPGGAVSDQAGAGCTRAWRTEPTASLQGPDQASGHADRPD